jgi:catechol-2,3-dioxygenase
MVDTSAVDGREPGGAHIGDLKAVVLDTPDIKGLSAFYVGIAGVTEAHVDDDWITASTPEGWHIAFQLADDHVPPRWPDPAYPQQMHLDLVVPDMAAAVAGAVLAGATRLPGGGETFTVLADPAGHPFCLCQRDGVEGAGVADVCIDSPDGAALARFYAPLLGMEVTYEGAEGAMISAPEKLSVIFQNVETYTAPRWPDPGHPQQLHLDVQVTDVDEAERRVLALGATKLATGDGTFRVYADPVGHPFCLVW